MNILKAYQIASQTSEYICVLGDSYRFKNRLDSIMDLLLPCDLNLLVLNRECEFSGIHSRYYYSADEILSDLGGGMDLIGSIVVNKKLFWRKIMYHICGVILYMLVWCLIIYLL